MTGWPKSCHDLPVRLLAPIGIWMVAVLLLAWDGGPLHAQQSFSRTIDQIKVFSSGGKETIQITFSQPFQDAPSEEHKPGTFSLRFSATGTNISRDTFKIRDQSTIREYRVVQNQYAATVVVNLRDPEFSMRGGLGYAHDGKVLTIVLKPSAVAQDATRAAQDRELLAQAEKRIGKELATSPAPGIAEPSALTELGAANKPLEEDWLITLVTMLGALGIVLLVLYGIVWGYNRFLSGRFGTAAAGVPIRMLGSFHISPKQRIVVLDINGEVLACGVTPQSITLLTRLGATRALAKRKAAAQAKREDTAGEAEQRPASSDPVHQFADTLKEKVRSLKRIK